MSRRDGPAGANLNAEREKIRREIEELERSLQLDVTSVDVAVSDSSLSSGTGPQPARGTALPAGPAGRGRAPWAPSAPSGRAQLRLAGTRSFPAVRTDTCGGAASDSISALTAEPGVAAGLLAGRGCAGMHAVPLHHGAALLSLCLSAAVLLSIKRKAGACPV